MIGITDIKDDIFIRNNVAVAIVFGFLFAAAFATFAVIINHDTKYIDIVSIPFGAIMGVIIGWYFGSQGLNEARRREEEAITGKRSIENSLNQIYRDYLNVKSELSSINPEFVMLVTNYLNELKKKEKEGENEPEEKGT